ncbi:Zinc/iron-chelating domain-containing protein [Candidatus Magnetomoraceae bacterium gMMP-15]
MKIFECKKCGDCCKGYGGTYLTQQDVKKIANYIKTDTSTFVEKYCQISGKNLVIAQAENGYCIFWDKLCTIHPVKPRMCKAWPYIKSVLKDEMNWKIMGSCCPGIKQDIAYADVVECVKKELAKSNEKVYNKEYSKEEIRKG